MLDETYVKQLEDRVEQLQDELGSRVEFLRKAQECFFVLGRLKAELPEWKEHWKESAKRELSELPRGDCLGRAANCKEILKIIKDLEEQAKSQVFVDDWCEKSYK